MHDESLYFFLITHSTLSTKKIYHLLNFVHVLCLDVTSHSGLRLLTVLWSSQGLPDKAGMVRVTQIFKRVHLTHKYIMVHINPRHEYFDSQFVQILGLGALPTLQLFLNEPDICVYVAFPLESEKSIVRGREEDCYIENRSLETPHKYCAVLKQTLPKKLKVIVHAMTSTGAMVFLSSKYVKVIDWHDYDTLLLCQKRASSLKDKAKSSSPKESQENWREKVKDIVKKRIEEQLQFTHHFKALRCLEYIFDTKTFKIGPEGKQIYFKDHCENLIAFLLFLSTAGAHLLNKSRQCDMIKRYKPFVTEMVGNASFPLEFSKNGRFVYENNSTECQKSSSRKGGKQKLDSPSTARAEEKEEEEVVKFDEKQEPDLFVEKKSVLKF